MHKTIPQPEPAPRTPPPVVFPRRPQGVLTCPHCWTTQQARRNRCYYCGASFLFEEDTPRPPRNGA